MVGRPGTRTRVWYVTASHRVVRPHADPAEVPFGPAHLKEVGAHQTACGLPALNWQTFWDLALEHTEDPCAECRWIARYPAGRGPRPGSIGDGGTGTPTQL